MRRAAAIGVVIAGALRCGCECGCASTATLPPPGDLVEARIELLRVASSPLAEGAADAIAEAEAAITAAEREPAGRSADAAYVALRLAQQAQIAAMVAAERDALEKARSAARRIAADTARRETFFTDLGRRRRAEAEARARRAESRRAALESAVDPTSQLVDRPEGILVRLSTEALFLPGTSLLRSGAEPRLAALAAALRRGPACDLRIEVLDDADGFRTDPGRLAERRSRRIRDTLRSHGVPADAFEAPRYDVPCGAQVDVLVIERPVVLPVSPADEPPAADDGGSRPQTPSARGT